MAMAKHLDYSKYIDFGYKVVIESESNNLESSTSKYEELFISSSNDQNKIEARIKTGKYFHERLKKFKDVKSPKSWEIKMCLHLYYYEDDFGTTVIKYDQFDLLEFKYNLLSPIVYWNNFQHEFYIVSRLYAPVSENEFEHIELVSKGSSKKSKSTSIILDYGLFNMYEILI